ncbi:MAG: hypothetical protein JWL91_2015 [Sphingomonas bacterium]|nr:hypothetical protein [Sphingomonas bacterium]MDB5690139.1 hypothetical protein [Sphingomonas bacterium]
MIIVERVARVLAGQQYSGNAHGEARDGTSASDLVDMHWRDHVDDALAVLRTLRGPDAEMCAAGAAAGAEPAAIWDAMVRTAINE